MLTFPPGTPCILAVVIAIRLTAVCHGYAVTSCFPILVLKCQKHGALLFWCGPWFKGSSEERRFAQDLHGVTAQDMAFFKFLITNKTYFLVLRLTNIKNNSEIIVKNQKNLSGCFSNFNTKRVWLQRQLLCHYITLHYITSEVSLSE
jgi:hypothetical protein